MTRDAVKAWLARFLLERVREDDYPSTTSLDLIESTIPRDMLPEYLHVLMDKVSGDRYPSIWLLRRIRRVANCLPRRYARDEGMYDDEDTTVSSARPEPARSE